MDKEKNSNDDNDDNDSTSHPPKSQTTTAIMSGDNDNDNDKTAVEPELLAEKGTDGLLEQEKEANEDEEEDVETGLRPSAVQDNNNNENDDNNDAPDRQPPRNHIPVVGKIRPALRKAGDSVRHVTETVGTQARRLGSKVQSSARNLTLHTQLAVAAAKSQTKHQLQQIGSTPLETSDDGVAPQIGKVKGEKTDAWITSVHAYGIHGFAIVTGVAALTSMIVVVAHLTDWSSMLTMVLAPLVFWQKTKLQSLGDLRGQHILLRSQLNRLVTENDKLESSIQDLESQVRELHHVEEELDVLARKAGGQVDRLVRLVHENGLIQAQIKEILNDDIMQQIVTAMINADKNEDYMLNKTEVRQLEFRLRNMPGVVFHHDRFQNFLESDEGDLTLADVTRIARQLQDPNVPDEERIFEYNSQQIPKKSLSPHHASTTATATTAEAVSF